MLFGCEDNVQAAGGDFEDLRYAWLTVHATRNELHDLRSSYVHYAASRKSTIVYMYASANFVGRDHLSRP